MCDDCKIEIADSFTEGEVTHYYRVRDYRYVETSLDRETWREIDDLDLKLMTEEHIAHVMKLIVPF